MAYSKQVSPCSTHVLHTTCSSVPQQGTWGPNMHQVWLMCSSCGGHITIKKRTGQLLKHWLLLSAFPLVMLSHMQCISVQHMLPHVLS